MLMFAGMFSGPIFDKGYFRGLVISGAILTFLGMLMTSFATKYYQILLAQGICMGIGMGLMYIPSVAVLTAYFRDRREIALGIAASDSGSGGVIYPAILLQLEPTLGFGWATRVISLIMLVTVIIAVLIMRRRIVPTAQRKLIDTTAFRDVPYILFTIGLSFGFLACYIPFYYISIYATAEAGTSARLALYLVPIMNAASILGRIVPNAIADKIGAINTVAPCVFACGVLALAWIAMHSTGALLAFALLFGFFNGTFVSIMNAAVVNLTDDMAVVGTRFGMSFLCAGVGILVGSPIAGALIDEQTKSYVRMQVFCGVLIVAAFLLFAAARVAKVGWAFRVWI